MKPEELDRLFVYVPFSGALTNRVDRHPYYARAGKAAGSVDEQGYMCVCIKRKRYKAHRIIWAIMTGRWPEFEVDHKDRDPTNNRWGNLREATRTQNARNKAKGKGSSRYKGVSWSAGDKRWRAHICVNHRRMSLGSFLNEEDAAAAYDGAAKHHFGVFAAPQELSGRD